MTRILRRWMIVGTVVALLAGACSDGGEQVADEGSRSANAPAPMVSGAFTPVVSGISAPVVSGALAPVVSGAFTPVVSGALAPVVSGMSTPVVSRVSAPVGLGEAGSGPESYLALRLSEGKETLGESSPTVGRVDGEVLDDAEIRAVIDRLPPWDGDDGGATAFNRPVESLPPPRTGRTVNQPFPAGSDIAAPVTDPGPLEVLRVQPEGEVGIAPFVGITFNQPMVPLATIGQLEDSDVPAEISPPLPGHWQWIGTRTLRFEHDQEIFDRLPMATSYVVEIPAGTESQSGGELAETFRFEFETPPPSMVRLAPAEDYAHRYSLRLDPVFLATFDQRVEPSAVLGVITLLADGQARQIRLASAAEVEADDLIGDRAGRALDGTWVAFRPVVPLEPDSSIEITVGPHVPSAEGPNTNENSSTVQARTYAPLRIVGTNCSRWVCRPGDALTTFFNNLLDTETLDTADISVTPEIPDATISVGGNFVSIAGPTLGSTAYTVVIPGMLGDVFGQTLGEPETVEFEIAEARPLIHLLGGDLTTIDPLGETQAVPVIVRQWKQLRVRLYAVDPSDYWSYVTFASRLRNSRDPFALDVPWPLATEEIIDTGIDHGDLTEVPIHLADVLNGGHGHVVMIVEGAGRPRGFEHVEDFSAAKVRFGLGYPKIAWVQDTDIGVDLITDRRDVAVWTTDLRSGDPLAGVEIELGSRDETLVSGDNGLARASLDSGEFSWVVASLGADRALSPAYIGTPLDDQTIWYTTDDRGMYRPGEALHLKGWVRNLDLSGDGDLEFLPSGQLITYSAVGPFRTDLGGGEVRLDDYGGFDLALELSEGANLGWSWIEFQLPGTGNIGRHTHSFQVQEFRRPEFEVEARLESADPHFIDEPAAVAVDARYFSGGPLPGAEVSWTVTTRRGSYSPPNWRDFTFGIWHPWWGHYGGRGASEVETLSGSTDAAGSHHLRIDFEGDGDGLPTAVTAQAQVVDVNRQRWASATDLLVHSADLYVGLRSARNFVRAGDGLDIEAVVTDLDGNPVADRDFEVTAERLIYRHVDGEWVEVALDTETCETTSRQAPVDCEFAAETGGRYRIGAHVVDGSGRTSRTEVTRWVAGGMAVVPSRNVELEVAELIPDAETYADGDTAEILVGSPFASATGLLTVAHNRIIELRTFEITDHTAVLEVPITDDHVPELRLRVDIVATTARTAADGTVLAGVPPRPAHASGEILLRVPPAQQTLDVTATPAATVVQPGAATRIAVEVNDAGGVPVEGANVLLIVVDEAVLAVSGHELIDPIDVFYRPRSARLDAARSRGTIVLENPQWLHDQIQEAVDDLEARGAVAEASAAATEASDDMAADSGGSASAGFLVAVRENLDALALFDPDAVTDATGRVTVEFDLPDNLTRYRVMAVAVDGADRFGVAESAITARLPLQVRPSAPRFLNYGDEFELPIVVQNQTDSAMEVDVVVQTSNLELVGSAGRRVVVPANDRVEVRFPVRTVSPGTARFRAAAVSAAHADAQVVSLPVYTPATSEAFATYGVVDGGAVIQPIAAPEDVIPQFGGLEVNTSSTALQALTDAVLYIAGYGYRSCDGYAGRIMAISALRDVLAAFDAEGLAGPEELDAAVRRDIAELASLQNYDGGCRWWSSDQESRPYPSIQAMHALVIAKNNGFDVPSRVMENGYWYLQDIERRIPPGYSQRGKDMLMAYALYVRSLGGQHVADDARALWDRRGEALPLDALAWLWQVVDEDAIEAEIERIVNNRAVETAGAATFVTDYGEDAYLLLHSDRRTDGIVLDALITMAPTSDLIPKVVAGLLAHRTRGRWNNIQENTFILLALNSYFDTFEATDPDFVARVWLGDLYAAEHEYSGRSTDRASTLIPMAELLETGDADLVVQKDGEGLLYYRLGLRYAPDDLDLDPLDRGFVVQRSYEAVGDPGDVWLDDDGVWHVLAGAEVRVNVTMVNDSRRTNMVLIDPLPAGFEPLNPALAVTGEVDARGGADQWWWWTWYRHQNLRDDRAEAFASYLWAERTSTATWLEPPRRAPSSFPPPKPKRSMRRKSSGAPAQTGSSCRTTAERSSSAPGSTSRSSPSPGSPTTRVSPTASA